VNLILRPKAQKGGIYLKKVTCFVFLLTFLLVFSIYYVNIRGKSEDSEVTLVKSFDCSDAEVVSSEIYFWAKLNDRPKSIKYLSSEFTKALDIDSKKLLLSKLSDTSSGQKQELRGITAKEKIVDMLIQLNRNPENTKEEFITVGISEDLSADELYNYKVAVLKVFKKLRIDPKVNSCITGNFDGKLDNNQLNEISKRVFKGAEASKVEGMRENEFISISAYSPNIEEYIRSGNKKVNLNLALRYNTSENKTYIWLATPVITVEY
jgi:hypothetical protein